MPVPDLAKLYAKFLAEPSKNVALRIVFPIAPDRQAPAEFDYRPALARMGAAKAHEIFAQAQIDCLAEMACADSLPADGPGPDEQALALWSERARAHALAQELACGRNPLGSASAEIAFHFIAHFNAPLGEDSIRALCSGLAGPFAGEKSGSVEWRIAFCDYAPAAGPRQRGAGIHNFCIQCAAGSPASDFSCPDFADEQKLSAFAAQTLQKAQDALAPHCEGGLCALAYASFCLRACAPPGPAASPAAELPLPDCWPAADARLLSQPLFDLACMLGHDCAQSCAQSPGDPKISFFQRQILPFTPELHQALLRLNEASDARHSLLAPPAPSADGA